MSIDQDDPRPPYLQIANQLRAAILTKKLAPGEKLPSGAELAKRYGVARQTVQNGLDILRGEGLIVSRQGSGVFVRERAERPVGLRPHVERAFTAPAVTLDFAGFSGETLFGAVQEPLDRIREGRLTPESISIRILLPDMTIPMGLPCRAEDLADDPDIRERMNRIMLRNTQGITDSVAELAELGLVGKTAAEIRVYGGVPLFKLYILNKEETFFGFYPVVRHSVPINGEQREIFDPMGKNSILFQHSLSEDPDSKDSQFVEQAQTWFDGMWSSVGREVAAQ
jgi:DNA-binding transcriptional regulator YhcF (GntR family)